MAERLLYLLVNYVFDEEIEKNDTAKSEIDIESNTTLSLIIITINHPFLQ